jgi:hypothetical protein
MLPSYVVTNDDGRADANRLLCRTPNELPMGRPGKTGQRAAAKFGEFSDFTGILRPVLRAIAKPWDGRPWGSGNRRRFFVECRRSGPRDQWSLGFRVIRKSMLTNRRKSSSKKLFFSTLTSTRFWSLRTTLLPMCAPLIPKFVVRTSGPAKCAVVRSAIDVSCFHFLELFEHLRRFSIAVFSPLNALRATPQLSK